MDYAQKMAFSPLVASNWYKVTHTQLLAEKVRKDKNLHFLSY